VAVKGDAGDLKKAMRSVRIDPVLASTMPKMAQQVQLLAKANLAGVPGTFSRRMVKIGKGRGKGGRFAGGVELSGTLALVAEYGMSGRRWSNWHGGYVQRSRIPPPRFGSGRPGPEDGYVLGKAYRMLKEDLTDFAADELWTEYSIQFDRAGIFKVRG